MLQSRIFNVANISCNSLLVKMKFSQKCLNIVTLLCIGSVGLNFYCDSYGTSERNGLSQIPMGNPEDIVRSLLGFRNI